ncbi:MAG TPA: hypothetical protein VEW65_13635, partial [Chryseolinea sp.]|nr:hypothetical protein [Chryseolinea sp.]
MMKSINISTKFTVLILAVSLVAVAAISFFSYDYHLKTNQEKFATNLAVIADNQTAYFNSYFERAERTVQFLQNSDKLKSSLVGTGGGSEGGIDLLMAPIGQEAVAVSDSASVPQELSLSEYLNAIKSTLQVADITITSGTGAVKVSTDPNVKGNFIDPDGVTFDRAKTGVYFSRIQRDRTKKNYLTHVAGVVHDTNGGQHVILVKLDLTPAYRILKNYYGLGVSGEVILARQDAISKKVELVSPLRHDTTAAIQLRDQKDKFVQAFAPVFEGKSITVRGEDYKGDNVLQTSRKIERPNLALIAKIDLEEANGKSSELISTFAYSGLCIAALATLAAMMFGRSFTQPLYSMRNTLSLVAQGVLPEASGKTSRDEFGQMSAKVDELVKTLKGSADFAQRVGEGKYDTAYKPASDNDILGMSLINMRNNLIENERLDKERNWI